MALRALGSRISNNVFNAVRALSSAPGAVGVPQVVRPQTQMRTVQTESGGEARTDLLERYLSRDNWSRSLLVKSALADAREGMERRPGDCGSTEVQVAQLTRRISFMTEHLQLHKKDKHSRRGLQGMLDRRRKLLKYFRRAKPRDYEVLVKTLGLKDQGQLLPGQKEYPKQIRTKKRK